MMDTFLMLKKALVLHVYVWEIDFFISLLHQFSNIWLKHITVSILTQNLFPPPKIIYIKYHQDDLIGKINLTFREMWKSDLFWDQSLTI